MNKINIPEQFFGIWWKRVGITVLVVHLISYFIVMGIVSGFATYLGLQTYDYPDQTIVDLFVKQYVPTLTQICLVLFTFFGSRSAAKNVESDAMRNGLAVGVLVAITYIVFNTEGLISLSMLRANVLILAISWLGALSAGKKPAS